jgi:glucose dehydrogenase
LARLASAVQWLRREDWSLSARLETDASVHSIRRTGKELWTQQLDYNVTAIPMSYQGKDGKQYVAVVAATNGTGNNESLRVFALP